MVAALFSVLPVYRIPSELRQGEDWTNSWMVKGNFYKMRKEDQVRLYYVDETTFCNNFSNQLKQPYLEIKNFFVKCTVLLLSKTTCRTFTWLNRIPAVILPSALH